MVDVAVLEKLSESLEKAFDIMIEKKLGTGGIEGKYAEILVANKLKEYNPQIGEERDNTEADIYLKIKKGIRIEVKCSNVDTLKGGERERYWYWSIRKNQIEDEKFDYCILVMANEDGRIKPEDCLILTFDDFKEVEKRTSYGYKLAYFIIFFENLKCSECINKYNKQMFNKRPELYIKENGLEKDLHKNLKNYQNKWDKIK